MILFLFPEQSVELRSMLLNPHLREMILNLAQSSTLTVDRKLEQALTEPIFTEFSDKCIAIVDDHPDLLDTWLENTCLFFIVFVSRVCTLFAPHIS